MGTCLSRPRFFLVATTRVVFVAHALKWRQSERGLPINPSSVIGITRSLSHVDFSNAFLSKALISAQLIHAQLVFHGVAKGLCRRVPR